MEYEANWLRDFNGDGDYNDTWPVWRDNGTFIIEFRKSNVRETPIYEA
jgi:hypothetical protein